MNHEKIMTPYDLNNMIKQIIKNVGTAPSNIDVSKDEFESLCKFFNIKKLDNFIVVGTFGQVKVRCYGT